MIASFAYPGGKVKIREWLLQYFPKFGHNYGEPFAGRGNVFWAASCELGFQRWHLNDTITAPFLKAVGLVRENEIPSLIEFDTLSDTAKIVLEPSLAYSGKDYASGLLRFQNGEFRFTRSAFIKRLRAARQSLETRNPTITAKHWPSLNWWESWTVDDFIYVDPPYYRTKISCYPDIDHVRLIQTLKGTKARWILSGYPNLLYSRILGEPLATTELGADLKNKHNGGGIQRVEAIWRNW